MNAAYKDRIIILHLFSNEVGQILDGLHERMMTWRATEEYLETGYSHISDFIEECSHPYEARAIASFYEHIINSINQQLEAQ